MKRVMCLYRVSTKGQVDKQDDIPMQRRECMDFINRMDDWVFVGERMEKGISGYKVSASKRDAIIEIREMAEKKQFDVLLVFMFDRLGRKEDETPFLVKWFIEHGIEVWSTREGQQKLENQVDRLLNFMRYWAASGESEKTSMRVKAAHSQLTKDGLWRGGNHPFGYRLVHKGRVGKKNRKLLDLEIDETQASIVKEIFDLTTVNGYGASRIANYLNTTYPNPKKIWSIPTIRTMLQNPIYTGRLHMNDILSEPIESLRIISDEQFEFVKHAVKKNIITHYWVQRNEENETMPINSPTKTSVYGATLLSGLLYCAHCNHKLVGTYCTKNVKLSDGIHSYHRPVYRCYNGAIKAKNCNGQSVYSAKIVEGAALPIIRQYFLTINQAVDDEWQKQTRKRLRDKANARLKNAETTLKKLQNDQIALKQEVIKSINGESSFDADMLKEMIEENHQAQIEAEHEIFESRVEAEKETTRIKALVSRFQNIKNWMVVFDSVSNDVKKMIIAHLVEKITVDRDYNIKIHFFVSPEDFKLEEKDEASAEETITTTIECIPEEGCAKPMD